MMHGIRVVDTKSYLVSPVGTIKAVMAAKITASELHLPCCENIGASTAAASIKSKTTICSSSTECSFQYRHLQERNHLNDHLPSIPFKNCLSRDGLEARVDKLTLTLLLQWRSEFNRFGGRDLDLLVRMRMSSPSFNRLPSESRSFE